MPRLSKILIRLAAVALGLGLALALLEVGLLAAGVPPLQRNSMRAFHDHDPRLGWLGAPDYRARFVRAGFDVVVEAGPEGFRSPDPAPPPGSAETPEILFLGDSFTWGYGVSQGALYTDVLQVELENRARILARGVNGFSTGQQLLLLRERLLQDPPDVVVVAFYFNDLFENQDPWSDRRPWFHLEDGQLLLENQPVASQLTGPMNAWTRRSRVITFLGYLASRMKAAMDRDTVIDLAAHFPLDDRSLAERWELEGAILATMRDACAAAGSELRAMYVAPFFDLVAEDQLADYASFAAARFGDELATRCAALGIPLLDSRAAFAGEELHGPRGEPFWHRLDDHWSAAGHRAVGRWLAGELGLAD